MQTEESAPQFECKKHGILKQEDLIKAGKKASGDIRLRCKLCMSEMHARHYETNKDKITEAQRKYKESDPEQYREMKNRSQRKMRKLDQVKFRKRNADQDKRNPEGKKVRQKRSRKKAIAELKDSWIKQTLYQGTKTKAADIPPELIELKRAIIMLKRKTKEVVEKKKINLTWEKMNELKDKNN